MVATCNISSRKTLTSVKKPCVVAPCEHKFNNHVLSHAPPVSDSSGVWSLRGQQTTAFKEAFRLSKSISHHSGRNPSPSGGAFTFRNFALKDSWPTHVTSFRLQGGISCPTAEILTGATPTDEALEKIIPAFEEYYKSPRPSIGACTIYNFKLEDAYHARWDTGKKLLPIS